jgi:hypothetical protein
MENNFIDREQQRLAESLDKIILPEARTPVYKQMLKNALIDQARTLRQPSGFKAQRDKRYALRLSIAFALPIAAILLLVAVWPLFIPAPQTYAHIVLEVNPALKLRIDDSYNVTGFEALDPKAGSILDDLDLRNLSAQQAVTEIVDRFYRQGLLTPERRMVLVIYPVADVSQEFLAAALDAARTAANRRILELNMKIAVSPFVMDTQSYETAEQAGLRPSQYSRLLEAGLSPEMLAALFKTGEELKLDGEVFSARFAVAAELIAELIEAGLSKKEAADLARELLAAGVGTDLLKDAAENILDRVDDGENPKQAIKNIRRLISSGRLHELKSEDDEDDENKRDDEEDDDEEDRDDDKNGKDENDENDNENDANDNEDDKENDNENDNENDEDDNGREDERPGEKNDETEETDESGKY